MEARTSDADYTRVKIFVKNFILITQNTAFWAVYGYLVIALIRLVQRL